MYRVVLEELRNVIAAQRDELSGLRQRLIQFCAFIGATTGFLVGAVVQSSGPGSQVNVSLALIATVIGSIMLMATLVGLWPVQWDKGPEDVGALMDWINADVATLAQFASRHAGSLRRSIEVHEAGLRRVRVAYLLVALSGLAQLGCWITQAWQVVS